MLLPIKPICSASKIRRDGTSLIFIQYCEMLTIRLYLIPELQFLRQFWNKKLNRVSDNLPTDIWQIRRIK